MQTRGNAARKESKHFPSERLKQNNTANCSAATRHSELHERPLCRMQIGIAVRFECHPLVLQQLPLFGPLRGGASLAVHHPMARQAEMLRCLAQHLPHQPGMIRITYEQCYLPVGNQFAGWYGGHHAVNLCFELLNGWFCSQNSALLFVSMPRLLHAAIGRARACGRKCSAPHARFTIPKWAPSSRHVRVS